jgi:hypothetical protein
MTSTSDRIEGAVGPPALDLELGQGQIATEAQVGLDQADADIQAPEFGGTRQAPGRKPVAPSR